MIKTERLGGENVEKFNWDIFHYSPARLSVWPQTILIDVWWETKLVTQEKCRPRQVTREFWKKYSKPFPQFPRQVFYYTWNISTPLPTWWLSGMVKVGFTRLMKHQYNVLQLMDISHISKEALALLVKYFFSLSKSGKSKVEYCSDWLVK